METPIPELGATEAPTLQPQPLPQSPETQLNTPPRQITAIPGIQGINLYYALGPGNSGPQLYSYDVNLNQWRIAQPNEMEQVMVSLGIPPNAIAAIKNFRL